MIVNMLDELLAPIATLDIPVNVGIFTTGFAQETFKKQVARDGVYIGKSQCKGDGGPCGAAADLGINPVLPAELLDLLINKEETIETQLVNQGQLSVNLLLCPGVQPRIVAVTLTSALFD